MSDTALIMGASGRFGSHAAAALSAAGWTVKRYDRQGDTPEVQAQGAAVIVNAMNPANYANWSVNIPAITELALRAARSSGARIIIPGNVYNFGEPGMWGPNTPQNPVSRKGRIRVEMEQTYRTAAKEGVQTIVLRAGDFMDSEASGTWVDLAIAKDLSKGKFTYLGQRDVDHAWAYLPDLGRAVVELANQRNTLPAFADIPYAGYTLTGAEFHRQVETICGRSFREAEFPWWFMRLAGPVWPTPSPSQNCSQPFAILQSRKQSARRLLMRFEVGLGSIRLEWLEKYFT